MAIVTCPNCGKKRTVVAGKRKNCRKCGQQLTSKMAPDSVGEVDKQIAKLGEEQNRLRTIKDEIIAHDKKVADAVDKAKPAKKKEADKAETATA